MGQKQYVHDCVICCREVKRIKNHATTIHRITVREYVTLLHGPGICPVCQKDLNFDWDYLTWNKFCSKSCAMVDRWNRDHVLKESIITRARETIGSARASIKQYREEDPEYDRNTREWKSKLASEMNASQSNRFGGRQSYKTIYRDIIFDSSWESEFAYKLDLRCAPWLYHPRSFTLENGRGYTPDFLLPSINVYVEIKPRKFQDKGAIDRITYIKRTIKNSGVIIIDRVKYDEFFVTMQFPDPSSDEVLWRRVQLKELQLNGDGSYVELIDRPRRVRR